MPQARDILVRAPNWTGDLVMATPGFRALRAGFPAARITLQLRAELAPLLSGAPWFDALAPLRGRGARGLGEARALSRRGGFDIGLCLPDSFSAALLLRASGARFVVGYRRGWRRALLHRALPRPGGRRGWIARERHVLGLVEALGAPPQGGHLELFTTAAERAAAESLLSGRGVDAAAPLAVLAPGASYGPSKLWPAERFAQVGDALAQAGAQVLIAGTLAERALCARVAAAMRAPAANLGGALDLGGLKAVLQRARVLLCNDAGARHIAVAFGVPCVVTMGPTALAKTDWNLEQVTVLSADVECSPCYHRVCPIDHRCMTQIPAARAADAALAAFESGGPGRLAAAPGGRR